MSNKSAAEKYGVSRNAESTWVKNKEKLLVSLERKITNSKQQKLRSEDFKKIDKAVFTSGLLVNETSKYQ